MRPLENGDLLNSKLFCLIRALEILFYSLPADLPGNKSEGVNRGMQICRSVPTFSPNPSICQYFCLNPKPQPHLETGM